MDKKKPRRMGLSRETLRDLNLGAVRGGEPVPQFSSAIGSGGQCDYCTAACGTDGCYPPPIDQQRN